MLVLTRRIDETLVIGDRVTVTVLQVRGDRVRFGMNAPSNIRVRRFEQWSRTASAAPAPSASS
jgi:carbon storage regulator